MSSRLTSCVRCGGTGLVVHKGAAVLCLTLATAWCIGALLVVQYILDRGPPMFGSRRGVVAVYLLLAGPPVALAWLGLYSSILKRGCPDCTS